jgi:hypothetical protein
MRTGARIGAASLAAAAICCVVAGAAAAPKIDPQADKYLKKMCSFLAGLKAFSFRADESVEQVRPSGLVLEMSNRRRAIVSRPDHLAAEVAGDTANRLLLYDGKTATLFDRNANVYATTKEPATIDATLDDLFKRYGISVPLADLLMADPYKVITERVTSGNYLGAHRVGDARCRHLALRGGSVDAQIWIDAGEQPLPRRMAIRFKRVNGAPRYSATLSDWNLSPEITEATFAFQPPAGAHRIAFMKVPTPPTWKPRRSRK